MTKNIELERAIARKRKVISKHSKELQDLLDSCNHEGYVVEESSYFPGGYYDKATTTTWAKCTLCGKTGDRRVETHNWYG